MDSVSPGSGIPLRALSKGSWFEADTQKVCQPTGQTVAAPRKPLPGLRCCPIVELLPDLGRALNLTPSTAEKWKLMHTLSFALDCRDTTCHLKAKQGKGLSERTVSIPVTFQLVC